MVQWLLIFRSKFTGAGCWFVYILQSIIFFLHCYVLLHKEEVAGNVQVVYITIRWNRTAVSSVILSLCKFEKSTRLNILKIELTDPPHIIFLCADCKWVNIIFWLQNWRTRLEGNILQNQWNLEYCQEWIQCKQLFYEQLLEWWVSVVFLCICDMIWEISNIYFVSTDALFISLNLWWNKFRLKHLASATAICYCSVWAYLLCTKFIPWSLFPAKHALVISPWWNWFNFALSKNFHDIKWDAAVSWSSSFAVLNFFQSFLDRTCRLIKAYVYIWRQPYKYIK